MTQVPVNDETIERLKALGTWATERGNADAQAAFIAAHELSQPKPLPGIPFLRIWMQTPNPQLGNVSPLQMMRMGRGDKLAVFIEQALGVKP